MSLTGSASAADERGGKRAGGNFAERALALEKPGAGEAAEHRERRDHEHEMAQAIVERRMRQHREQDRKKCGQRHQHEIGAPAAAARAV